MGYSDVQGDTCRAANQDLWGSRCGKVTLGPTSFPTSRFSIRAGLENTGRAEILWNPEKPCRNSCGEDPRQAS